MAGFEAGFAEDADLVQRDAHSCREYDLKVSEFIPSFKTLLNDLFLILFGFLEQAQTNLTDKLLTLQLAVPVHRVHLPQVEPQAPHTHAIF